MDIKDRIKIIKGLLVNKHELNPNDYDEISEILEDIQILSDAKTNALLVRELNPAIVLSKYLWKRHPDFQFKINNENKIYVDQQELLEVLMDFQKFVLNYNTKLSSGDIDNNYHLDWMKE